MSTHPHATTIKNAPTTASATSLVPFPTALAPFRIALEKPRKLAMVKTKEEESVNGAEVRHEREHVNRGNERGLKSGNTGCYTFSIER
jgi:hypothetical protein